MARRPGDSSLQTGFTLIEVLVVVAIIALLISILLPSLKTAREQANITVCKTRMQQIYRGHFYYGADNRDIFPHWSWWLFDGKGSDDGKENFFSTEYIYRSTGGVRSPDSRQWLTYGDIFKYVRDKQTYLCPTDSLQRGVNSIGGGVKGTHAIHSYVRLLDPHQCIQAKIDGAQVGGKGSGAKLQQGDFINPDRLRPGALWSRDLPAISGFYTVPSRVGMLYEEDQGLGDVPGSGASNDALNDGHSSVVVYRKDFMSPRHLKKGNMAYFDGHVELMDAKRWNNYPQDNYVLFRALGGGSVNPAKPGT